MTDPIDTTRTILRHGLFALLLLTPLPFGAVQPWALLATQIAAAGLAGLAIFVVAVDPSGLPRRTRQLMVPALILVGVGVLQLVPAPDGWTRILAAPTHEARAALGSVVPEAVEGLAPQSLEPPRTLDATLRLATWVLIGIVASVAVRRERHLVQALFVIVAAGSFQALYGSAEYLSGHQHIFGYAKTFFGDEASGTFINRNHFAFYLDMALPLALGLTLRAARQLPRAGSWRERLLQTGSPGGLALLAGAMASAAIWAGVLLSYSRTGLAMALLGSLTVALRAARRGRRLLVPGLLAATALLLLLPDEIRAPGEPFFAGSVRLADVGGRLPVWAATLGATPRYALIGSGFGTFEELFTLYRPPTIDKLWNHAHNDWLQLLAEGGLVSLALVAWMTLSLLLPLLRRGPPSSSTAMLGDCLRAAVLAAAAGSLFDFGLRIPANVLLLATLAGLACRAPTDPAGPRGSSINRPRRIETTG